MTAATLSGSRTTSVLVLKSRAASSAALTRSASVAPEDGPAKRRSFSTLSPIFEDTSLGSDAKAPERDTECFGKPLCSHASRKANAQEFDRTDRRLGDFGRSGKLDLSEFLCLTQTLKQASVETNNTSFQNDYSRAHSVGEGTIPTLMWQLKGSVVNESFASSSKKL